jgi:Spy/CpxP family protein refolding chaperone
MRTLLRVGIGLAVAATLALVGARALAHGGGFERHFEKKLEGALDAAKATPEQRLAVRNAVEHVTTTLHDMQKTHAGHLERALGLFEADKLDAKAVAAERAGHEASMQKVGDAVVQAISDAHDALTAPQRKAVVDYLRAEHQSKSGHDFRGEFVKRMISVRIDAALDEIGASEAQRATVHAAAARVAGVIGEGRGDHGAQLEQALALFAADKLDLKAVDALRAEHQARARKIGDVVVQAITEVHDALNPAQRKQVGELIREHHERWGHHG